MNRRGKDRDGILEESGTCEETALLDAYLDGELTEDEAARLRAHLDTCPACRAYLDDIRAIREAFPTLDDVEAPEGFAERVLNRLPPRISVLRGGWRREAWRRAALPIAASLALVLALRGMWLTGGPVGGEDVFTRSLPGTEEAVQETEKPFPAEIETVPDVAAEDAAVQDAEETASAAEGTERTAETADNADTSTVDGDALDAGTPEGGGSVEADAGTVSAAAENVPTGTETVPSGAETAAGTGTTPSHAGNKNEEKKPAETKNTGTNSKTDNSGKSSNSGKTGGTASTGNQQYDKPAAPKVPAAPQPAVPAATTPAVPVPEGQAVSAPDGQAEGQAVTAPEGQNVPTAAEQSAPAETPAPQAEQPEDGREGFYPVEAGSSYVSGYENLDGEVALFEVTSEEAAEAADTEVPEETERTVRNTAHRVMYLPSEAASWLERYSPVDYAADGVWYELSGQQFTALARALDGAGLVDDGKWAAEAAVTEANDTVYVVLRIG